MSGPAKFGGINRQRVEEALKKRQAFIASFERDRDLDVACAAVGITKSTYQRWRERYDDFGPRIDALRLDTENAAPAPTWDGGFASFRKHYFGMASPWFHLRAIRALEQTRPGNIVMILWPPEHGKTTLFEDYASYKLAVQPDWRCMVGSEKQAMSKKVLARIKARMSAGGPFREYVAKWGPFTPQNGQVISQPWAADHFNVHKKKGHDERDYSMVALGIGSAVAGSRTDQLHVDDVMSLKNYNQTPAVVETFRQDWLSRPGEFGRTSINGTRVGEQDFYEVLMDEFGPDIMQVIKLPAIVWNELTQEYEPLWPERYSMDQLERIRTKVGEEAWARNYMQNPLAAGDRTFTDAHIKAMANPTRKLGERLPGASGVITVDPALGGYNVVSGFGFTVEKLSLVDIFEDQRLTSYEQVFARLEEMLLLLQGLDMPVTDVVIEANAFQKGLQSDRQLLDLQDRYGFNVGSHLTGDNKYDEEIGIASMARDCRLGKVELPYAGDSRTRHEVGVVIDQLKRWRPHVKGARLRQDRLMTIWFAWIRWRARRSGQYLDAAQFSFSGMPYRPTNTGLIVPTGALR